MCYFWEEYNGKRGASEIASCLRLYILSLPPSVKHLIFYSDCCSGQNRNRFVALCLHQALQQPLHLQSIEHKFLVSGHTQMPIDSMHSAIETAKKHSRIYVPDQWHNIICLVRRHNPYKIVPMQFSEFLDYKSCISQGTLNVDTEKKTVGLSRVQVFKYVKEDEYIYFKHDFNEESFRAVKVPHKAKRSKRKLYNKPLPINEKKKDLVQLCKDGVIPRHYYQLYTSLQSANTADRLPEPDFEEDESSSDSD